MPFAGVPILLYKHVLFSLANNINKEMHFLTRSVFLFLLSVIDLLEFLTFGILQIVIVIFVEYIYITNTKL